MTWQTRLLENSGIVEVICVDQISKDDWTILAIEIGFLVRQHGGTRILIDLSKSHFGLTADDVQELTDIYVEYHVPKITRTALVVSGQKGHGSVSKSLSAPEGYGYEIMSFTSDGTARDWLQD